MTQAKAPPKIVLLWSTPRSISSAFQRSIITLSDIHVIHEPFNKPYYFGPERGSKRFASRPVDSNETYEEASLKLTKGYEGKRAVFSKSMAYAVENKFELFLAPEYKYTQHTFLIRNPEESVPALYRASKNPMIRNTGWVYFDPEEAGFRQMYELYQFIVENIQPTPVVVDANDLLEHPDQTMKRFCDAVGITFQSHMTSWEPGEVPEMAHVPEWHQSLFKTSGFMSKKTNTDGSTIPDEVKKVITDAKPYYEFLKDKSLKIFAK